jgi:hypothetical protein
LPLAAVSLALAFALGGCATTRTGGPGVTDASAADAEAAAIKGTRAVSTRSVRSPSEGPVPLRAPARVMRIWIAPWEDSRGDLHAPGYVYTEIEPRHWALGARAQRAAPIRPLQIERREAQPNSARSGRDRTGSTRRDAGSKRTPGKAKVSARGPNLLGS